MVCPKFNAHVYKLKRWAIDKCLCFYFPTKDKEAFLFGNAQCSKKIDDGPINMGPSKKKTCDFTQELINMNHTLYIIVNNVGLFI